MSILTALVALLRSSLAAIAAIWNGLSPTLKACVISFAVGAAAMLALTSHGCGCGQRRAERQEARTQKRDARLDLKRQKYENRRADRADRLGRRGRIGDPPDASDEDPALAESLRPIGEILARHPQRLDVAAYFEAAADAIERDGRGQKLIATAEVLRRFNCAATTLRFQEGFQPAPGLADALNHAMLQWVGPKAGELDVERRAQAVAFYCALADLLRQ